MRKAGGRLGSSSLVIVAALVGLVTSHSEAKFNVDKVPPDHHSQHRNLQGFAQTCASPCLNGQCFDGVCACLPGWGGDRCDRCGGRIKITNTSTVISDGPAVYKSLQRCTWIVENAQKQRPTTFHIKDFSTECGWDHLYVYDGAGIYKKQLTALCGAVGSGLEIMAPSGDALLFFSTDMAVAAKGFNISFNFDRCPYDCYNRGECTPQGCSCHNGFSGLNCELAICTENNNPCLNKGICTNNACNCTSAWHGDYCQKASNDAVWNAIAVSGKLPDGRASHTALTDGSKNDIIWIIGGYSFSGVQQDFIITFNTSTRTWIPISIAKNSPAPEPRYDHSVVKYKYKLYMFGGVKNGKDITSEFWEFDMNNRAWTLLNNSTDEYLETAPFAVAGHTAHVINHKMFVFFGYNPQTSFSHQAQIYDFDTKTWTLKSFTFFGRAKHSSVVIPRGENTSVLIFGGTTKSANYTDELVQIDIESGNINKIKIKKMSSLSAVSPPALSSHSAVLLNNLMIVVGGSTQNSTECFNDEIFMYDTDCQTWSILRANISELKSFARYGHSAVLADDDTMYVFGGFNGTMREDIVKFTPANCDSTNRPEECRQINGAVSCVYVDSKCQRVDSQHSLKQSFQSLVKNELWRGGASECVTTRTFAFSCEDQKDCIACTSQNGCGWCPAGNQCLPANQECLDAQSMLTTWEKCSAVSFSVASAAPRPCSMATNCYACKLLPHCNWYLLNAAPQCVTLEDEAFFINERRAQDLDRAMSEAAAGTIRTSSYPVLIPQVPNVTLCALAGQSSCESASSCADCMNHTLRTDCMWCPSADRCINKDAYTFAFAYGQCQAWVDHPKNCQSLSGKCEDHQTCSECQELPGCGWIDDGSKTGVGRCVGGSDSGPLNTTKMTEDEQWFFTTCPDCQCNGHSTCFTPIGPQKSVTALRCDVCKNHTTGPHCQHCSRGFFGDARNGGICKPCECNGQADDCDNKSGACYCITKGVIGDHCDKCDTKYVGNMSLNETCRYELAVDFIFTFKLKNDSTDQHVREILLFSQPYKKDTDVTFVIHCEGSPALVALNLTSNIFGGNEFGLSHTKQMMVHTACDEKGLRRVYLANDPVHPFGTEANTTFFVKVYNFTTPMTIQISFAQSPPINWVLFFVIFAACFIVLLVVAGLLWMIKLRIEVYRRNQNRINEIEHMASRPFASVRLELTNQYANSAASPVAIEPSSNYKFGIYTLAVRLPTGGRQTTPNGTSGFAVASAICTLAPSQTGVLTASDGTDTQQNRKRTFRSYIPFFRNAQAAV